ncbi:MAG TPA: NAD(P)/FAD-dependent oxidoreductase [Steroidobacteraceae bacterium]|nr:NAD(P)/FAD-dependent oxidoreductase [Steroidobacteraceae bacterium]
MSARPLSPAYDAIVIGAGHNGLVCATLLARAGQRVLVLEAAETVGGCAVTREFAPGFRVSAGAHLLSQMPAALVAELGLARHGLDYAATALPTTALSAEGAPLEIGDPEALARRSPSDARAFPPFAARLRRFAGLIGKLLAAPAPRLGSGALGDKLALARLGLGLRLLGRREMRELLRIIGMNAYDLVEDEFETELLKGALAFDAVLGANFGPRAPGTVLTLLYRLAAEAAAGPAGLALPRGGLGALTRSLAEAAKAAGATIRTASAVARVAVEGDRAAGVVLESGESIGARTVISNADAKTTFLRLLGAEHLDTGFVRRVDHFRSRGVAAKLHLALDRAPAFTGCTPRALGGRLLIAPSPDAVERAWNHSKYGEWSAEPALEISIPTVHDPALAPAGRHVLSAIVQYAPYAVEGGWAAQQAPFLEAILARLEAHAPGLKSSIVAAELATPPDLEREFRMHGGHWHHGDLAFDQFYMVRPVPGAAQHATPLAGLYLCGASCHPGGGVMGIAGRNAARRVLREARA